MKNFLLCYITDRRQLGSRSLASAIRQTLRAGVDMVQIREKDLAGRDLTALAEEALSAARELPSVPHTSHLPSLRHRYPSAPLRKGCQPQDSQPSLSTRAYVLVNDRLDVALGAGADGVHLGGQSMPLQVVRQVAPHPFLLGASCHSLAEAMAAESGGADYLVLGPIFETPSKLAYGPPLGLEELRNVASQIGIPVLALGGITVERVQPCLEAGACGIAGIRIFQDCRSVEERIRALRAQG
jgi:thiamine-phosphate pyrophosphorylase